MYKESTGIAPEGFKLILASALLAWVCAFFGFGYLSLLFLLLTFFNVFFFRDPEREITGGMSCLLSPADGKVVEITEEEEPYFLNQGKIRVSIFLSILDCHINRFPVNGKVISTSYREGGYGLAYKPEASTDNERLATLIKSEEVVDVVMVQIAGLVARRIVSYADVGMSLKAGDRFGMIKYGSRVDIYLPVDSDIRVETGTKVKAGETIIACLRQEKNQGTKSQKRKD